MRIRRLLPGWALLLAPAIVASAHAQQDLCPLNDEFNDPLTLGSWQQVHVTEQWNANPVEFEDIGATRPGFLTMIPYTVTWYANYRGPLRYKRVSGDFVLSTSVRVTGRDSVSVPSTPYSLGGIMIRTPRNITPATWTPGGENYVFLSNGYGNAFPSRFQFEVKTTVNSSSTLILSDSPGSDAELRIARIGAYVIALRRSPGDTWRVHRRYARNDFPDTLQAGMVAYTDWDKASDFTPFDHNRTSLHLPLPPDVPNPTPAEPFHPDVRAQYDFMRFARPQVPAPLVGADLTNATLVTDAMLLAFLGDSVDSACSTVSVPGPAASIDVRLTARTPWTGTAPLPLTVEVPAGTAWRLAAYDLAGRRLGSERTGIGPARLSWRVAREDEESLGPGVYFLRLTAGSARRTARIVRIP